MVYLQHGKNVFSITIPTQYVKLLGWKASTKNEKGTELAVYPVGESELIIKLIKK